MDAEDTMSIAMTLAIIGLVLAFVGLVLTIVAYAL